MEEKKAQELLALVKRNYAEIAASFDATRKKEIWPEIRTIAADVPNGARVLDLGCGNGRLLEVFKNKNVKYLGIDNSEALIKHAQTNYPENKFIVADLLSLDRATPEKFNYIFCLAVLQHIPSPELRLAALKQMKQKLEAGGRIIISVWNLWQSPKHRHLLLRNYWLKIFKRNDLGWNDLLFPWKNSRGEEVSERYYHAFTKKELKKLARLAGLRSLRLNRDKHNFWVILENK
ncbi:MAG: class I SAM-dependent methyltransferase [Patescibacteria group bacterium]